MIYQQFEFALKSRFEAVDVARSGSNIFPLLFDHVMFAVIQSYQPKVKDGFLKVSLRRH